MLNKQYTNIEDTLLARVGAANRRYIRFVILSIVFSVIFVILVFGAQIRKKVFYLFIFNFL